MLQSKPTSPISRTFFALGTINDIKIFDSYKEEAVAEAIERVAQIEEKLSAFKPESDISKLRRNSGKVFQPVSEDTFHLIRKATQFSKESKGAFDITIRPLVELWGINKKGDYVPSEPEIREALRLVSYKDILFNTKTCSIALKKPGQALDLGGIAKGYAADEVKRILIKNGVNSAMINLGGNVAAVGKRPDGKEWQIGIQNPLAPTGEYLGALTATDKTIVTSGSNERFFIKNGIRYHHIIDPRTGKPAQSSLLSVTVVCDSFVKADALTTALFILGREKGMRLLKKFKAEAIFVTDDLTTFVTKGLSNNFKSS